MQIIIVSASQGFNFFLNTSNHSSILRGAINTISPNDTATLTSILLQMRTCAPPCKSEMVLCWCFSVSQRSALPGWCVSIKLGLPARLLGPWWRPAQPGQKPDQTCLGTRQQRCDRINDWGGICSYSMQYCWSILPTKYTGTFFKEFYHFRSSASVFPFWFNSAAWREKEATGRRMKEDVHKDPRSDSEPGRRACMVCSSTKWTTTMLLTCITLHAHYISGFVVHRHTIGCMHAIKCVNKRDVHVAQSAIAQTETINHKCMVSRIAFFLVP